MFPKKQKKQTDNKSKLRIKVGIVIVLCLTVLIIYNYYANKQPVTNCDIISYYKIILDNDQFVTKYTTFNNKPIYLQPYKYCNFNELPVLSSRISTRYIAIVNYNNSPMQIPYDSFKVYTSDANTIPINSTQANVIISNIEYPNPQTSKKFFSFNNSKPYIDSIPSNMTALIRPINSQSIYTYSISFKYTGPLNDINMSILLFDPPSTSMYSDMETNFTSFYQINLDHILINNTIIIDFE